MYGAVCRSVIGTIVRPPPIVVRMPAEAPIHTVPRIVPRIPIVVAPIPRRGVVPRRIVVAPRVAPTEREVDRGAPATEHRGDVLRLDPHLIAHHDDVVERRVVCRQECVRTAVTQVVVARRHIVVGRVETAQTTCIGTFVGVGDHARVVEIVGIGDLIIFILGLSCLSYCYQCLIFGTTSLGFGLHSLVASRTCVGLGFGDSLAIVGCIQVVVVVVGIEGRRTPSEHRCCGEHDGDGKDVPHSSFKIYIHHILFIHFIRKPYRATAWNEFPFTIIDAKVAKMLHSNRPNAKFRG